MPKAKVTFENLFRGESTQLVPTGVDYTPPPGGQAGMLLAPQKKDSLANMVDKLRAISEVVAKGKSAAVQTGFVGASGDPVYRARKVMTRQERVQYDAWKEGVPMPEFKWLTYVGKVPAEPTAKASFERHAQAMDVIWRTKEAKPVHAAYVFKNMTYAIPLVMACGKIIEKRQSIQEYAEIETIHRCSEIVSEKLTKALREQEEQKQFFDESMKILQAREEQMRDRIPSLKRKREITEGEKGDGPALKKEKQVLELK